MKKHILLYTDDPNEGGVAQYNHSLLCKLAAAGYEVTCIQTKNNSPLVIEQQKLGVQHLWLDYHTIQNFPHTLENFTEVQRIFANTRPDLIIFSDGCPVANFAAREVAMRLGIPYILVEGFVAPYLAAQFPMYLPAIGLHYEKARAVIAVSHENLKWLHDLFQLPKEKGNVIYYGRPAAYFEPPKLAVRDRLRRELNIPTEGIVCFTAARLEEVKGHEYQLAAIAQLKNTAIWSQLYFVWAGGGSLEPQLRQIIDKLGVSDRVKLVGQQWNIENWLDASDIFVLTSKLEGMPLAVMEAMAKGLPVIATSVSGIPEELGSTGKLLPDPKINASGTIRELVTTLQSWCSDSQLRQSVGQSCQQRAKMLFRAERMLNETLEVIERALLPLGDYVSPGLAIIRPDEYFPNMIIGDTDKCSWPYLRREIPHNWYVDQRKPDVGFLGRDEAQILYNTALKFQGKRALEIGCWLGWSACHLALAGVQLDVVDPLLSHPQIGTSVRDSLHDAGVLNGEVNSVNLVAGYSPQKVEELAAYYQRKWSLIFIDGNHDVPAPLEDAIACAKLAEDDAIIVFHDLASPDVAQGLDYFQQQGWQTLVYQTMQIMGVAWRGNVEPVKHIPDPKINWSLPKHLETHPVSGLPLVSVIIPCYNHAQFLPEAVASVIAQTYENWEIIIVNDGSTDNTNQVAQGLIAAYSHRKIRLIEKQNGGPARARNTGIAAAQGEYILPLDADDKLSIKAIDTLVKILVNSQDLAVAFGSYERFGTEQQTIDSAELYSPENIKRFNMIHPSSLFSKKVWESVNGYQENIGYEDWEFWLKCHKQNIQFLGTREVIVYYRKLPGSRLSKDLKNHQTLFKKLINYHPELFDSELIKRTEIVNSYQLIEQYQKDPNNPTLLEQIRQIRKQLAQYWLETSTEALADLYLTDVGNVYRAMFNSPMKYEPLTDSEKIFVDQLIQSFNQGFQHPQTLQALLGLMLYCYPHQLRSQWYEGAAIPKWLLNDYLKFLLSYPDYFQKIGEAETYFSYIQQVVNYLHGRIKANQNSQVWENIALIFAHNLNLIPLYFTDNNLKEIYIKRAEIIEQELKKQGHLIDWVFPDSSSRNKIRLGILKTHFASQTETYSTLPAFENLDKNLFEVFVYTLQETEHPLESHCFQIADKAVKLPRDLANQVQTIRADDLDILLIATNVTAVTNQIVLLALHRLARIQVTSNASPVTTGMRSIDYYISGQLTEKLPEAQTHYSEKLILLEGTAHCFNYSAVPTPFPRVKVERSHWGANPDTVVFISGANYYKIIPELRETWAKILAAVPNSILVLYPFNPNWNYSYPAERPFIRQMRSQFTKYGIEENRLVVLQSMPSRSDILECLKQADIYLDSYPFAGVNSTVDPLEVGLPVVVWEGETFRSHMGASLLRDLQITDLIAATEVGYLQLAIALANNPVLRHQKRQEIQRKMQNKPGFLNGVAYSAQMGNLFQELFQIWQRDRGFGKATFPESGSSFKSLVTEDSSFFLTQSLSHKK